MLIQIDYTRIKRPLLIAVIMVLTGSSSCLWAFGLRDKNSGDVTPPDTETIEETVTSDSIPKEEEIPEPTQYSIPWFQSREYDGGELTLLDSVPAKENRIAREFTYISDGLLNYGLIEQPSRPAPPGGWPVILLVHGFIPPSLYSTVRNYRLVTQYYATGDFIVVKPDYRGHGRSESYEDPESSIVRTINYSIDVLNLLTVLKDIPDADLNNVFLYGHSMGGEIVLRILEVGSPDPNISIRGATIWAGVTVDYPENSQYYVRQRNPEIARSVAERISQTFTEDELPTISPNYYLDQITVPLVIHHGTEDEDVPYEWSIPFRENLDKAGVNYTFYEYPGEDHNISRSFYRVMDKDMEFFRSLMVDSASQ